MSSVTSGSKGTILVTGASGFIAAHVVFYFLDAGYKVIGTVRNEKSAENIRQTSLYKRFSNNYSFRVVPDISVPGAFDEAVKGVDGVIHTQSPFFLEVNDNEKDLLIPAIQGTVGILKSIKENNPKVKRVVITSSFASILDLSKGANYDYTFSEKDWNPATYEEAKNSDNGGFAYCASKGLAERAAHQFVEEEKPNFTVTAICPPAVLGPNLHYISDLSKMGESPTLVYNLMNGSHLKSGVPATPFPAVVDVRDCALAHLLAYENPKAAGQRYLTSAGAFTFEEICGYLLEQFPDFKDRTPVPTGKENVNDFYRTNNSKIREELGLEFRSLKETIIDSARNFLELEKTLGKN